MGKYLDPKADLTFKKVFGEHPNLVISLLNALLPLEEGQEIKEVEYLSPERVPWFSSGKYSIVDVMCKAKDGRHFIVEMQMYWTTNFKDRVLFNSAKVYVEQLRQGEDYSQLKPVYTLSLVNDIFEPTMTEMIHHYQMVHDKKTEKVIDGLHLVFVELPKFKPQNMTEKKMAALWLRFLTEIDDDTREVPKELRDNGEISQAMKIVEETAYTREQLEEYNWFWDKVRLDRNLAGAAEQRYEEGLEVGRKEGLEEGEKIGAKNNNIENARKMKEIGLSVEQIRMVTGLTEEEIERL